MEENKLEQVNSLFPAEGGASHENPPGKLGFFELLYGILFQPGVTLEKVAREIPLLYSFFILIGVTFLNLAVAFLTTTPRVGPLTREMPFSGQAFQQFWPLLVVVGTILFLVFTLVRWYISAGIIHLAAEFLGGRSRAMSILAVLGCVPLPTVFVAPLAVILYALNVSPQAGSLISLPFAIWTLVLMVTGIRRTYHFTTARAVGTLLIPLGLFIAIAIIIVLAMISFAAAFVRSMPGFPGI